MGSGKDQRPFIDSLMASYPFQDYQREMLECLASGKRFCFEDANLSARRHSKQMMGDIFTAEYLRQGKTVYKATAKGVVQVISVKDPMTGEVVRMKSKRDVFHGRK